MSFIDVAIKSAWWSKVNWTQAVAMLASVGVFFGLDLPPEQQAKIAVSIQALSGLLTIILRTWFTTSVTPAAAARLEDAA